MRKKLLYPASFLIACYFLMAAAEGILSSGAPASKTGAPGELTCATSGCHDDYAVNSGPAKIELLHNDQPLIGYIPGVTYKLKVKITDETVVRFGFQLVALDGSWNNSGTMKIVDSKRTQLVKNAYDLFDRVYATYTYDGTATDIAGSIEWEVDWMAPSTNVGDVTFYFAGVSANDDGEDSYDHVLTQYLKISSLTSVHEVNQSAISVASISDGMLVLKSGSVFTGGQIFIYTLDGRTILNEKVFAGEMKIEIPSIASGLYLISIVNGSEKVNQKIVILK